MCWKRKPPTPIVNCKKMLLTYAVNNYPGSSNDLNGCVNDQTDLINALSSGWSVTAFRDHEVTVRSFNDNVKNYILGMTAGDFLIIHYSGHGTRVRDYSGEEEDGYDEALYLYDGTFTDDQFNQLMMLIPEGAKVMVVLDSCFSGTATRRGGYSKAKYIPPADGVWVHNKIEKASGLNHILFSGCRSDQTSADAYINGRYNGAFTFFWLRAMNFNMTYREWIAETVRLISLNGFEQVPQLEGPEDMLNQKIFT